MKQITLICLFSLTCSLSSCFEIIEELNLEKDNSGTFIYTINLSDSRMELGSILKLDSFKGKNVPSQAEVSQEMEKAVILVRNYPGISSAEAQKNWSDYVFTFTVKFDSLAALNSAIENAYNKLNKTKIVLEEKFLQDSNYFLRGSQINKLNLLKRLSSKEIQDLPKATYTCVYRFEKEISSADNSFARVSKNKKAVMLKTTISTLINKKSNLNNKITFKP